MGLFRKKGKPARAARKRCRRKLFWKNIIQTRSEEQYHEMCASLEEAGIEYRIWMIADHPTLIYLRDFLGPEHDYLRRYYIFLVRPLDARKACHVLKIDPYGSFFKASMNFKARFL